MANTSTGYGNASGNLQTATRERSGAGKTILLRSQKAVGTETTTLEYADVFVCGGG
jgi:hypothetical protein